MTAKMTERDKKLLAGLSVFCLIVVMVYYVILPLKAANLDMKNQAEAGMAQIEEMDRKSRELPELRARCTEIQGYLAESQNGLYPMLEVQEIDELLTEKVVSAGLKMRSLQVAMPEEPADVMPYLFAEETDDGSRKSDISGGNETSGRNEKQDRNQISSNPKGADGIWIAEAGMEIAGSAGEIERLVGEWSESDPGMRVTGFEWRKDRHDPAGPIMRLRLEILMSRNEGQGE